MDVQVARDRLETAQHRLGIAGDHCDGSENVQALKTGKAKPEIRTLQVLGTRLQQADERVDGDEAVRLLFGADGDTEARQERLRGRRRVRAPDRRNPAGPRCGSDCPSNITCREMIKTCRELSRPAASPTAILLVMNAQHFDILIIGAGLSGIGTACQLTAEFPHKTIAVLERRERLGGTWDLFRYPGIRSDSDMLTFGYKFRPWQELKVLADGPSIRQYIADTAAEYGVDEKIQYGLKIVGADWSSAESRWTVTAVHEATGETRHYTCGYLISCTGYYNYDAGYLPTFPGAERFTGRCVHPQHWPEDLDYTGKKVVVIGSGATAVTLVPAMAGDAGARDHAAALAVVRVLAARVRQDLTRRWAASCPRKRVYALGRKRNIVIQRALYKACRRWPKTMRRFLLSQVRRRVGPSFDMSHFTPKYMPWDERLCAVPDGDLFDVLASGEASVVTDQIETFTETGILLKSGRELEADIIVTATGLNLQMLGGMAAVGRRRGA